LSGGHYLSALFAPRSVALVGASADTSKVGGLVLRNMLAAGFRGRLIAVNPKHREVQGVACVANVGRLPVAVDLAVIATPPPTVPGILSDCVKKGIAHAVVITAGVDESKLVPGIRVLGPNCLGLMRPSLGLNATFARGQALPGSLALVSQSGAICTAMLDWATPGGIGFSSVVSMGAASDIDFGEVIDYLAADEKTEHILLYIEGIRDGRRLVSSLRAAARVKPVILMKVGRHPAGSRAAVSHTGAIVGRDDIFDAVARRTGAVRVQSVRELVAAAQALAAHVKPIGERLAIITNGGGPGVIAADRAGDLGIPLAQLSKDTIAKLQSALPPTWSQGNPVDLIGDASADRYRTAVAACLEDAGVDGLVVLLTPQAMTQAQDAAEAVIEAAKAATKPVVTSWMGEASVAAARRQLRHAGLPSFRGPEEAVETFSHLASFYRHQQNLLQAPAPLADDRLPDVAAARDLARTALAQGRNVLSATESKALLAAFRIPVAHSVVVTNEEEAAGAAAVVRYPVAMKIDSPQIAHKSDVGGVRLGIANAVAVKAAFREMMQSVKRHRPDAHIRGVSIEPMVSRSHARELMAGILRDPIFGPAIIFGAGGVAIEILHDRTVALPPLNTVLIADMIRGTRVARMLGDFRNLPAVDYGALESVLLRVSEIACELPEIEELDINPLVADEQGAIAIDARVVLRDPGAMRNRYAHLAIHPYPAELATTLELADGSRLKLRPIRPEDAELEKAFVAGLSDRSMRLRFLSGLRTLTPQMLARFTQIDYDREMAFIAVEGEPSRPREVGVCRYIALPDGETCEFAIVVADEWQSRGLGRRMMARLMEVAAARGLKTMIGYVAAENAGMLDLCAGLGFAIEREPDDPHGRRVVAGLPSAAPAASLGGGSSRSRNARSAAPAR
jgi:acetyltransferase